MTAKKVYVLNGHPASSSLSKQFANAFAEAADVNGHEVRVMHLDEMSFDMDFGVSAYVDAKPLEPELKAFQDNLLWCDDIVLLTPMWWGGLPAKLKGLLDRTLLPGFAFDPRNKKFGLPAKLLTGRSAYLVLTSDSPDWYFRLVHRRALVRSLRIQVFGYVGINLTKVLHFAPASKAAPEQISRFRDKVVALGKSI